MLKYLITLIVTSFLLGFTLHALLGVVQESYPALPTFLGLEDPRLGTGESAPLESSFRTLTNPAERPSPFPRIAKDNIHVYEDKVVIDVENPQWASFTDTNSMDPVFDAGHYAIQEVPRSEVDIHIGDIITYSHPSIQQGNLIHRVIQVGYDDQGWYAVAKGDNNANADPGKVRFSQIKKVVAAIIY